MRIAIKSCPKCKGDLYIDYKANRSRMYKCLACSRIYRPHEVKLFEEEIREVKV